MSNAYALEARDVSKRFGGIVATNHVSIQVEKGKIFGIIVTESAVPRLSISGMSEVSLSV